MPCKKGMLGCKSGCLHRALVKDYYDVVYAREELRESHIGMTMEDDEFDTTYPNVTFKDWIVGRKRYDHEEAAP